MFLFGDSKNVIEFVSVLLVFLFFSGCVVFVKQVEKFIFVLD